MERITEWLPAVKRHHTPYHRQDQQGNHKSDYRTENVIPVEYTPWQDRLRELINHIPNGKERSQPVTLASGGIHDRKTEEYLNHYPAKIADAVCKTEIVNVIRPNESANWKSAELGNYKRGRSYQQKNETGSTWLK
jgi:hypothetical protein